MQLPRFNTPKFGTQYRFYDVEEARAKKTELAKQKIDSAIEFKSSDGWLQVVNWVVHTDENGTTDLTNFRKRGGQEVQ